MPGVYQSRSQSPDAFWSALRHGDISRDQDLGLLHDLPVSRRIRGLVNMASRDKVDVDTFRKGINTHWKN